MSKTLTIVVVVLAALLAVQTVRLHRLEQRYVNGLRDLDFEEISSIETAEAVGTLLPHAAPARTSQDGSNTLAGAVLTSAEETSSPRVTSAQKPKHAATDGATGPAFSSAASVRTKKRPTGQMNERYSAEDRGVSQSSARSSKNDSSDNPRPRNARTGARRRESSLAKSWVIGAKDALARGEFDPAAQMLTQSLSVDPANRDAFRTLARLYQRLGLSDLEMQVYDQWMAALPDDAMPHYLLAQAYARMGIDGQAADQLSAYQGLSEGSLDMYAQAANLYRRLGMYEEESLVLSRWLQEAPNSPDAHRLLADYYRRAGNYQAAADEYQFLANLMPNSVDVYLNMGRAFMQMDLYADAQNAYLTALDLRPADLGILLQLAQSFRRAGDLTAALNAYQSVIDLDAASEEAIRAARAIVQIQRQMSRA